MNKIDTVLNSRAKIQELYPVARIAPWEDLCRDNRVVFIDRQTSLSVAEMHKGSEDVIQQVVESWKTATESIYKNFHQFNPSNEIASTMYSFTRNSSFTEIYHLDLCGSRQYGIQGLMLWQQDDPTTIHINLLMTSPVNIPSPITNPALRVKRVGETCVHYLQRICNPNHRITLSSLIPAIPFYQRCGFQRDNDDFYDDVESMSWTRDPSLITQQSE